MNSYISIDTAIEKLNRLERESYHNSVLWPDHVEECREALREIEPADVVARDCYDRILAENDTMRKMLAQIGKKPGDSMDDVRPVVRCKDCIHAPLPGDCEGGNDMEWPKIDGINEDCTCPHYCDDSWYSARPDPDGFCEKGERREPNLDTTKGDNHD